ncbi:uncharacterized protein LOC123401161 [Hordeum vulgare subsp. vulgare]|nr:uncharacterized protein LOC123401161 [Hordeum vulgare subsp. vulgare]
MPGSTNLRDCKVLEKMVKMYAEKGELYGAICAVPAVTLAHWGMLKGLKATCYPSFMEKFTSEVILVNSRVVVDRNVVTSQGPGTAIEFALALVEQLYDKEKMEEVAGPLGTPCPLYFEFCGDGSHLTPKREWSDVRVVRKLRGLRQQEKFAARNHFRGLRDSQQAGGRRPTPLFMLAMDNLRDRKLAEQRTRDSDIPEYLTCPLCGQVMIDPVTIATGKTFDQQFLKDWFEKKGLVCPLTGEPVSGAIVRNERIRGYLKEWEDSKAELITKVQSRISYKP